MASSSQYNQDVKQAMDELAAQGWGQPQGDTRANIPGSEVQGDVLRMPVQGDPQQFEQPIGPPKSAGLDIPLGTTAEDRGDLLAQQDREATQALQMQRSKSMENEAEDAAQIAGTSLKDLSSSARDRLTDGIAMGLRGQDAMDYANARLSDQDVKKLTGRSSAPAPYVPPAAGKKVEGAFIDGSTSGAAKPAPKAMGKGGGGAPAMPQVGSISPRMAGVGAEGPSAPEPGAGPEMAGGPGGVPQAGMGGGEGFGLEGSYAMEGRGAELGAMAQAEGARVEGEGHAKQAKYLEDWGAQAQKRAELRDHILEQHEAHIQEMNAELANTPIDSQRYWKSRNTGQKIMMMIGAALGGMATGFTHGPNQVMEMIQKQMDADIDAQKADIENKQGAINTEHGLLGDMYKRFGNMEQAEQATRDIYLQKVGEETKGLMAESQSKLHIANGAQLLGQIGERQDAFNLKRAEFSESMAEKYAALEARKKGGGGGGVSNKDIDAYGKDMESHNYPQVLDALSRVRAGFAQGTEGMNPVSNRLGWDPRASARENITNVQALLDEWTKSKTRMAPAQVALVHKLLASGSEGDVNHALDIIQSDVMSGVRSASATRPDAGQVYWQRMGGLPGSAPPQQTHPGYNVKPIGGS